MKPTIRDYYWLTKPGLIYGNLLTVIGGYLYGAILDVNFLTLVAVVTGSALIMGSGCVINNVHDRSMDVYMKRTKKRATVTGLISVRAALVYATILAVTGLIALLIGTNTLTVLLGVIGLISYAGIYTYAKPRTIHATLIGTIPGSVPILAGYAAATNRIDTSFWILLALMVCWQMVHFYAIAIFRLKDYRAAKVPVMPAVKGLRTTKVLMLLFSCCYLVAIVSLALFGYAGLFYLAILIPLTLWWIVVIAAGVWANTDDAWARKVFFMSLLLLPALCASLGLNAWTP